VFSVTQAGAEAMLYAFKGGSDGELPQSTLINVGGTLFGSTDLGGGRARHGGGTIFSVTPAGSENVLHAFLPNNLKRGGDPLGGVIEVGHKLYGTADGGGARRTGYGIVFSMTLDGSEHVVYRFQGGNDGFGPNSLIHLGDTLYGTTRNGGGTGCGGQGCGTVFSVTPQGVEKLLYSFKGGANDGSIPYLGSLTNVGGTLYGTTATGGGTGCDQNAGCGTVFSITRDGVETVLYSFRGNSDGSGPLESLVNVAGVLYGVTAYGGGTDCELNYGCGTVFAVTP
jgi:uncharacterized repeat protein (TIGR03803 family)